MRVHRQWARANLQRVDSSDDGCLGQEPTEIRQDSEFKVRVAAAFADTTTIPANGDRARDNQVQLRQVLR